jgi:hypothetical protein
MPDALPCFFPSTNTKLAILPLSVLFFLPFFFEKLLTFRTAYNIFFPEGSIAGGTAGVVVETALYPIDTIKTRLQVIFLFFSAQ